MCVFCWMLHMSPSFLLIKLYRFEFFFVMLYVCLQSDYFSCDSTLRVSNKPVITPPIETPLRRGRPRHTRPALALPRVMPRALPRCARSVHLAPRACPLRRSRQRALLKESRLERAVNGRQPASPLRHGPGQAVTQPLLGLSRSQANPPSLTMLTLMSPRTLRAVPMANATTILPHGLVTPGSPKEGPVPVATPPTLAPMANATTMLGSPMGSMAVASPQTLAPMTNATTLLPHGLVTPGLPIGPVPVATPLPAHTRMQRTHRPHGTHPSSVSRTTKRGCGPGSVWTRRLAPRPSWTRAWGPATPSTPSSHAASA